MLKLWVLLLLMTPCSHAALAQNVMPSSEQQTSPPAQELGNSAQREDSRSKAQTTKEEGLDFGDVATWFSGIFTAAVFFFTLHAWREERRRNFELEKAQEAEKVLTETKRVACWVEKGSHSLRQRTGSNQQFLPDGNWALVLENGASFALFNWNVVAQIKNPSLTIEITSRERGPIGPNGGLLVLPISSISADAIPKIAIKLQFTDESSSEWTRDSDGLRRSDLKAEARGL